MSRRVSTVTVRVEVSDALTRSTDLLVLKHAQALHGLDREAVRRIGGDLESRLPGVGGHLVVPGGQGIRAANVAFIGVPPSREFGYADVRRFAERALGVARELAVPDLCMTLHGVGFGLDEAEAFRAQVAGLLDAAEAGDAVAQPTTVTFVDRRPRRAELMRSLLADLWPGEPRPRRPTRARR